MCRVYEAYASDSFEFGERLYATMIGHNIVRLY